MVVVGKVGCGKSSLLAALTGELDRYKFIICRIMKIVKSREMFVLLTFMMSLRFCLL